MKNCNNCNKLMKKSDSSYNGLCPICYEDYLMKKIDRLFSDPPEKEPARESFFEKLKNFFKRK